MHQYFFYILASAKNGTLYIGVTNNLIRRMIEHRTHHNSGFSAKYHTHLLVYFEETEDIRAAITREKQVKRWKRSWKIRLIEETNPAWEDLAEGWHI